MYRLPSFLHAAALSRPFLHLRFDASMRAFYRFRFAAMLPPFRHYAPLFFAIVTQYYAV